MILPYKGCSESSFFRCFLRRSSIRSSMLLLIYIKILYNITVDQIQVLCSLSRGFYACMASHKRYITRLQLYLRKNIGYIKFVPYFYFQVFGEELWVSWAWITQGTHKLPFRKTGLWSKTLSYLSVMHSFMIIGCLILVSLALFMASVLPILNGYPSSQTEEGVALLCCI